MCCERLHVGDWNDTSRIATVARSLASGVSSDEHRAALGHGSADCAGERRTLPA